MHIIRTICELRTAVGQFRNNGETLAFVPTMGALHEGHLSLVKQGKERADRVVASIFVNPKQFGPNEDFAAYPRSEEADIAKLSAQGVDIAYLPNVMEMYGEGGATSITVKGVSEGLCGERRPGHFDGVVLVVTKLLLQLLPDIAIFGEKDYQQLQVIKRLVADLNIPVTIVAGKTLREKDGLAMSSRNLYLSQEERAIAPALYRQLTLAAEVLASDAGAQVDEVLAKAKAALLEEGFSRVDYVELRDAESLVPVIDVAKPARLLAAAYLGKCRLIDNIAVLAVHSD